MVGVTWGPGDPFDPSLRWSSLLHHMLERQKLIGRDFAEDAVLCFDRLVLGRSQSLDWCGSASTSQLISASSVAVCFARMLADSAEIAGCETQHAAALGHRAYSK